MSNSKLFRRVAIISATLAVIGLASAGDSQARQRSATVTGPAGGQTSCSHSAGGGQSNAACTGPRGHTGSTGTSTTANGDGTVSRSRTNTGPNGHTGGWNSTISR